MTDKYHSPRFWSIFFLLFLVIAGLILHYIDAVEWRQVLEWAREYTQYWWLAPVLVGLQIIFYMFALPGSLFLWVATLLYPPVSATIILVAGSTIGGLAAYLLSQTLATPWKRRIQQNQIFYTLKARGDFITLLALRIMPGFPQSVINYSSGILHIPVSRFLTTAIIGLTCKTYLYAYVISMAVEAEDPTELIGLDTLWPLIMLSTLFLLAGLFQHYRLRKKQGK